MGLIVGLVIVGALCTLGSVTAWRLRSYLRRTEKPPEAEPFRHREDMIYIWTSVHGIPRERAEAMWQEYERATAAGALGLKGK